MHEDMSLQEMEIMKSFFEYWDNLENFRSISEDNQKICSQEIRAAIVDILAIGIEDKDPMTGRNRQRHVLNARELLETINQRLDEEIKKSNLYFHLQKLEEIDVIKVVDQIPRGKQFITYYARTAKAFTSADKSYVGEKVKSLFESQNLVDLGKKINPDLDKELIVETINSAFESYNKKLDEQLLAEWMEKHQKSVLELDMDLRRIFDLFFLISRFNNSTLDKMKKLSVLLDLDDVVDKVAKL